MLFTKTFLPQKLKVDFQITLTLMTKSTLTPLPNISFSRVRGQKWKFSINFFKLTFIFSLKVIQRIYLNVNFAALFKSGIKITGSYSEKTSWPLNNLENRGHGQGQYHQFVDLSDPNNFYLKYSFLKCIPKEIIERRLWNWTPL